ncbi:MAG: DEAD/DEAH box helicase, partial [Candidatus Woesearchaeota archaeon]
LSVERNHSVVVSAPTGSGKTLIADYIIDKDIRQQKRVVYTSPIKALSNQKFSDFCKSYGEENVGLVTGDLVIRPDALVVVMTTEVYRNMAIVRDPRLIDVSYCVMDEIHYVSDEERGHIWEESIIFSPSQVRFLFLSATIPNAGQFASWVEKTKSHKVDVVFHDKRPVPLKVLFFDSDLGIASLGKIAKRKELDSFPEYKDVFRKRPRFLPRIRAPSFLDVIPELNRQDILPCIYFVLSRQKTQDYAARIKDSMLSQEEKSKVSTLLAGEFSALSPSVVQLRSSVLLRQCLLKGVAFHHAGLLPDLKRIVEKMFSLGLIKVLFATETFAVGVNMPARTVCFDSLRKFTGVQFRYLNSKEFFQIAGRAGRRGMDSIGYCVCLVNRQLDDLKIVRSITSKDVMPIRSQFRLSPNSVLNILNQHSEEEIDRILEMNFHVFQMGSKAMVKARFNSLVRRLENLGYLKGRKLTDLGIFTTHIFSDELEISQLFCTPSFDFDEYSILLVLGSLVFEERKDTSFKMTYPSKSVSSLSQKLRLHPFLKKCAWIDNLEKVTALIYPCFEQKKFDFIFKNTNMPEGDVIKFFLNIMTKLEQVGRASDLHLRQLVNNCKHIIRNSLEGINLF